MMMLFYAFSSEMKGGKLASRLEETSVGRISGMVYGSTVLTDHTKKVWPVVEVKKIVVADWSVTVRSCGVYRSVTTYLILISSTSISSFCIADS